VKSKRRTVKAPKARHCLIQRSCFVAINFFKHCRDVDVNCRRRRRRRRRRRWGRGGEVAQEEEEWVV
jgi:hypothetical protein